MVGFFHEDHLIKPLLGNDPSLLLNVGSKMGRLLIRSIDIFGFHLRFRLHEALSLKLTIFGESVLPFQSPNLGTEEISANHFTSSLPILSEAPIEGGFKSTSFFSRVMYVANMVHRKGNARRTAHKKQTQLISLSSASPRLLQ